MAARPDMLRTYAAQSFVPFSDPDRPFYPPADYPADDLWLRPMRPRTPPADYYWDQPYPFNTYGESQYYRVVDADRPADPPADYDTPQVIYIPVYATPTGNPVAPMAPMAPMAPPAPATPLLARGTVAVTTAESRAPPQPTMPAPEPPKVRIVADLQKSESEVSPHHGGKQESNRAFQLHIRNHGQFNTFKHRTEDNCPICKAMEDADNQTLTRHHAHNPSRPAINEIPGFGENGVAPNGQLSPSTAKEPMAGRTGSAGHEDYTADLELRQNAYYQELMYRRAVVAKVLENRIARKTQELTVAKGEILEITVANGQWWHAINVIGQKGWVPDGLLQFIPAR